MGIRTRPTPGRLTAIGFCLVFGWHGVASAQESGEPAADGSPNTPAAQLAMTSAQETPKVLTEGSEERAAKQPPIEKGNAGPVVGGLSRVGLQAENWPPPVNCKVPLADKPERASVVAAFLLELFAVCQKNGPTEVNVDPWGHVVVFRSHF